MMWQATTRGKIHLEITLYNLQAGIHLDVQQGRNQARRVRFCRAKGRRFQQDNHRPHPVDEWEQGPRSGHRCQAAGSYRSHQGRQGRRQAGGSAQQPRPEQLHLYAD